MKLMPHGLGSEPPPTTGQRVGLALAHVLAWLTSAGGILLLSARLLAPFTLPWWLFVSALQVGGVLFHGWWSYYLLVQGGAVAYASRQGWLNDVSMVPYYAFLGRQLMFYCGVSALLVAVTGGFGGVLLAPLVELPASLVIVALEFLILAAGFTWYDFTQLVFGVVPQEYRFLPRFWLALWGIALVPSVVALLVRLL